MPPELRRQEPPERGAAVVEFTLVAVLLTALALGVVQVALALHVRNVLTAAAQEGARYGANADRGPEAAADRAREIIGRAIGAGYADGVSAEEALVDGLPTVEVVVRAPLPVVGFLGLDSGLVVRGHALEEGASLP